MTCFNLSTHNINNKANKATQPLVAIASVWKRR